MADVTVKIVKLCFLLFFYISGYNMQWNDTLLSTARLQILNQSDVADFNGTFTYDIEPMNWLDKLKIKVWEKLFPDFDDKLYMSILHYKTTIVWDYIVYHYLYELEIGNITYTESTNVNVLNQVTQNVNRSTSIEFTPIVRHIAKYHIRTDVGETALEVIFSWNENKTYVVITCDTCDGNTIVIVGYFRYCWFTIFISTKTSVKSFPSTCRKPVLYPYGENAVSYDVTLEKPLYFSSSYVTNLRICDGILIMSQLINQYYYIPFGLPSDLISLAAYHTKGSYCYDAYLFRSETNGKIIEAVSRDVDKKTSKHFIPHQVYIITYFITNPEVESYQAVLASDGNETYVVLNYEQVSKSEAIIGYTEPFRVSKTFFNASESKLVGETSNIGIPGRHVFLLTSKNYSKQELYQYGVQYGDKVMDSGYAYVQMMELSTPLPLQSKNVNKLYISTDGLIADSNITHMIVYYQDEPLTFFAPYHLDFDTKLGGAIYYRETREEHVVSLANKDVKLLHDNASEITTVIIITYSEVTVMHHPLHKNTFQLILAHNDINTTYAIIIYHRLDTKEKSIFAAISQKPCYHEVILDSWSYSYKDLVHTSNVERMGKHVYQINDGSKCKTALYPYRNIRMYNGAIDLKNTFLLFSTHAYRINICNGIISIAQMNEDYVSIAFPTSSFTLISIYSTYSSVYCNPYGTFFFDNTVDKKILQEAALDVQKSTSRTFHPVDAFMITYSYTHQALFLSDGNETYVILNYDNGVGDSEAIIGYSEPFCSWKQFFNATSSKLVTTTSNVGVPGRHVFLLTSMNCSRGGLYPFGIAHGDIEMEKGDNNVEEFPLKESVPLKSKNIEKLFISTNGIISGDKPIEARNVYDAKDPNTFIAAYHVDLDTKNGGSIYYRETEEENILSRANRDIKLLYSNATNITHAVVVTYFKVSSHDAPMRKNTFQVVIAFNKLRNTFVILNYDQLELLHQNATALINEPGCHHEIVLKYLDYFDKYRDLTRSSNVNEMGKFVHKVTGGENCSKEQPNNILELSIRSKGYDYVIVDWKIKIRPKMKVLRKGGWDAEWENLCKLVTSYQVKNLIQEEKYDIEVEGETMRDPGHLWELIYSYKFAAENVSPRQMEPLSVRVKKVTNTEAVIYWNTPLQFIANLSAAVINITHSYEEFGEDLIMHHTKTISVTKFAFNGSLGSTHTIHVTLIVNGHHKTTTISYTFKELYTDDSQQTIIISASTSISVLLIAVISFYAHCRRKAKKRPSYLLPYGTEKLDPDKSILEQCNNLSYDTKFEFPRKQLSLVRVLGEGAFGQVWMAMAKNIESFKPRKSNSKKSMLRSLRHSTKKTIVAVKALKGNATDTEYKDLANELKLLIHIGEHRNIVNLLGACTKDDNLLVILEYCANGALLEYLRINEHDFQPTWHRLDDKQMNLQQLTWIAVQIADGMSFLEKGKCVHRDLASRNILLTDLMIVKIADFGLARDTDGKEYYKKESDGNLPIKWMAPEAITNQKYTSKSDVWSFGIVLWEIYSLGACPYPGMKNSNVFGYLKSGKRMAKPKYCPDELYQIMLQCWSAPIELRSAFINLRNDIDSVILSNEQSFYSGQSIAQVLNLPGSKKYQLTAPLDSNASNKAQTGNDDQEKTIKEEMGSAHSCLREYEKLSVPDDSTDESYFSFSENKANVEQDGEVNDPFQDEDCGLYFAFTETTNHLENSDDEIEKKIPGVERDDQIGDHDAAETMACLKESQSNVEENTEAMGDHRNDIEVNSDS